MYFNVIFNVFFKLMKVYLLVSELYIYQNARFNDNKKDSKALSATKRNRLKFKRRLTAD